MQDFTKEGSFLIAESGLGNELYVFMEAKKDRPCSCPKIVYDGNDHALFYRNDEQKIILDYIHPDIRDKLRKSHHIMVVETILENIKESYMVDMEMVNKLPLDLDKYDLKNWEEAILS